MRRKDREVTDFGKMMEMLKACDCCRLGLVDGTQAYIVPMNFGYEQDGQQLTLYFHCAKEGRKMNLLPKQDLVAFEMDTRHELVEGNSPGACTFLYQCIMGTGRLELLLSPEERIHGLGKIMAHYTGREQWEFGEQALAAVNVLKLTVKEWSCKEHL